MKSCTARMKKAMITMTQAISSTMMVRKLSKKLVKPISSPTWCKQRPGGLEPGSREPAGLEQIVGGQAVGGRLEPEPGEGAVDDVGQRREIVQDEGEDADIEDLLDQAAEDVGLAVHGPEQAGQGDVDARSGWW